MDWEFVFGACLLKADQTDAAHGILFNQIIKSA